MINVFLLRGLSLATIVLSLLGALVVLVEGEVAVAIIYALAGGIAFALLQAKAESLEIQMGILNKLNKEEVD